MDVELVCTKDETWVLNAGCIERGLALGYPADQCTTDRSELKTWRSQPFYYILPDIADMDNSSPEIAAWEVSEVATSRHHARLPALSCDAQIGAAALAGVPTRGRKKSSLATD